MDIRVVIGPAVGAILLAACSGSPEETPPPPTGESPVLSTPAPDGQTPWIRERVQATEVIYDILLSGREWLEGYDLRQMVGQPGWFGSLGFKQWAGVGQAIHHNVLHEISHSYWGAFPITGGDNLSWEVPPEGGVSPALQQYRDDLKAFMFQPPDGFEPLRDRFRNLPNLSTGDYPDLFHHGEADMIYSVGGNLNLVPPILRKYFDQFLQKGEYSTWDEAVSWYLGLTGDDKRVADGYFGLTHFPLERYENLRSKEQTKVSPEVRKLLEREERQRLVDFAQQFDLIKTNEFSFTDAASVDRGFQFWKDYLKDMLRLHQKHPEVLATEGGAKGLQLKEALNTIIEGQKLSQMEQVEFFRAELEDPFFMNFAVLLHSRVLVELFGEGASAPPVQSIEGVVARFSQKLAKYVKEVDNVLTAGRSSPVLGALRLEKFMDTLTDEEQETQLTIIMDLLREADEVTARSVINSMGDEAILRIHRNKASALMNGSIEPWRLLQALDITTTTSREEVIAGIDSLLEKSSGNFKIDEPFTNLAYQVIADRGERDFQDALEVLGETQIPLLGLVTERPEAAKKILSSDLERAAKLISNVEGYAITTQGIIHGIIFVDADLAARVVQALSKQGREEVVSESLIVFAFDSHRLRVNPSLKLSLENDKLFLQHLIESLGQKAVQAHMEKTLLKYRREVEEKRIDPSFIKEYRNTLKRILELEEDPEKRAALGQVVDGAFGNVGMEAISIGN